jgi:hypothetical protein
VDLRFESASWADFDELQDMRIETQGWDSTQRYSSKVLRWCVTPGLVMEITDLIQEWAPDLISRWSSSAWEYYMLEKGHYLAVPTPRTTPTDVQYLHIRRDWLDQIDRDVPLTLQELEEDMRLFKQKGLGGEITIPLVSENPDWVFGIANGPYYQEPDEFFAAMEKGENLWYKPGHLETLRRWQDEALLNPEWTTWKYDQVYDACTRGHVGVLFGGWWLLNGTIQQQVEAADPTQDWVQIYPPLGLEGKLPETGRVVAGGAMERGLSVFTWASCPEAIICLLDWEMKDFDNYITDREGVPGKHWKWGEGGWIEDLKSPPPNQEYSAMRYANWTPELAKQTALLPPEPGKEPKNPVITERCYKTCHTRKVAYVPEQDEYPTIFTPDHWLPYKYPKTVKYSADLTALNNEYRTKIVKGEIDIEAGIKEYQDKWWASGGEETMQEKIEQWEPWIEANPEWKDPKASLAPDMWRKDRVFAPRKEKA